MKIAAALVFLLIAGCGPTDRVGNGANDEPKVPRPVRYRLVGLPTGPRLFFDQARCLQYLKTYAAGMEAGLGSGSSGQLRCQPENAPVPPTSG